MDTSLNPDQPANIPVDPMDKINPVESSTSSPSSIPSFSQVPPTTPTNSEVVENINVPHKSKGPLILLLSLFIILILLVGSTAFAALVAYGKVDINNDELQRKISFAVQELPYTPKTAEFLIYKSMDAQKDLKSAYIDASIAFNGNGPEAIPGLGNNFDLKITGPIDFHDENNPEAEIHFQMSPEFDANFVAVNDTLFFKINEIPAVIKGLASGTGMSLDILMNKWISYELKSLESDARSLLEEDKDGRDDDTYEKVKAALLNSDVIDKIVVTEEDLDGTPVYKMSLELTSQEYKDFVNEIAKAVDPESYTEDLAMTSGYSQTFENLKINTYIAKDTMHTVRSMISFRMRTDDISVPSQVLGASTIQYFPNVYTQAAGSQDEYVDVASVINASRFNEDFQVAEPENATPIEVIIEEYTKAMMQQYQYEGMMEEDSSGFGGPDTSQPYYDSFDEDDSGITPN